MVCGVSTLEFLSLFYMEVKYMKMAQEQLQREYDYFMAEKITKNMLKNGLITKGEYNKITLLNRQTFSPNLAQIMPTNG